MPSRRHRAVLAALGCCCACGGVRALSTTTLPARARVTSPPPVAPPPAPTAEEEADVSIAGTAARRSEALPWLDAPALLDGTAPGDCGFDPLRLARTPSQLAFYREAEIKHSRLAMLAAVGWPLSEMLDEPLARLCGLPCVLAHSALAPSVLNGGLGAIHPVFWGGALGSAAACELYALWAMLFVRDVNNEAGGHLRFDPLGFYPTEPSRRKRMRLAELKHGRTAMVAVVGYAAEEFLLGTPVSEHSEAFFRPFWDFLW